MDEDLAEAVDTDFYESYKRWKMDNTNATSRQQVNLPTIREKFNLKFRSASGFRVGIPIWGTRQHLRPLLMRSTERD